MGLADKTYAVVLQITLEVLVDAKSEDSAEDKVWDHIDKDFLDVGLPPFKTFYSNVSRVDARLHRVEDI